MKNPSPEDRDRARRRKEESEAVRRQWQQIIDRVDARRREREAWNQRSFLRRLMPW